MFKYVVGAVSGCLLACGTGPDTGGPLGPSAQEQRIAGNSGPRIATVSSQLPGTDPQAVVTNDPQAVPPPGRAAGGGPAVQIAPGEEGCKDFCAPYREAACKAPECEAWCEALRVLPGACGHALLQVAECIISATDNCDAARAECYTEGMNDLQATCPAQYTSGLTAEDLER